MATYSETGEEIDLWGDDFGEDVFALPVAVSAQASNPPPPAPAAATTTVCLEGEDEDSRIKALVNTSALDYNVSDFRTRAAGGLRRRGGRGFAGLQARTPPAGYVCHRCSVPGHFIHHCPTNGDPEYDIKRVRPPTGIPKSMLVVSPYGSYRLPGGASAVLKANEDAFDKEMEGLSSSSHSTFARSVPAKFYCPLCKLVMKDAMLTTKCCFESFCDKCIRDHLINSKLKCVCGKSNVLTDDLVPNKTLRDAIRRILESGSCSSSSDNATSAFRVQEMEPACGRQEKVPAPAQSAASTKEGKRQLPILGNSDHVAKKMRNAKASDVCEAQSGSTDVESSLGRDVPASREEVQRKAASIETGKQRRKKNASQDQAAESYMMPMDSHTYDSYWNSVQPWMQGYMASYANTLPYNAYGMPFFNAQGYMAPSEDF